MGSAPASPQASPGGRNQTGKVRLQTRKRGFHTRKRCFSTRKRCSPTRKPRFQTGKRRFSARKRHFPTRKRRPQACKRRLLVLQTPQNAQFSTKTPVLAAFSGFPPPKARNATGTANRPAYPGAPSSRASAKSQYHVALPLWARGAPPWRASMRCWEPSSDLRPVDYPTSSAAADASSSRLPALGRKPP
jgi:hypothetical protein